MAQPKAAIELLRLLHEAGVHTALDTCGAVSDWALEETLPLVDLMLFDVKTIDPEQHQAWTGVPFERVDASARRVNAAGVPVWVRTPVIPGYTADDATMRAVGRYVAETFAHCERHDLLAFSNLCITKYEQLDREFALAGTPLLDAEEMERLTEVARQAGSPCACWSGPTRVVSAEQAAK